MAIELTTLDLLNLAFLVQRRIEELETLVARFPAIAEEQIIIYRRTLERLRREGTR